jgi:hypothetical protein
MRVSWGTLCSSVGYIVFVCRVHCVGYIVLSAFFHVHFFSPLLEQVGCHTESYRN